MSIFAYYVIRISDYRTIYKFVVVIIILNEIKLKMRRIKSRKWAVYYGFYYISCHICIGIPLKDFLIFIQYLITHTQQIATTHKIIPHRTITTAMRY